MKKNKPKIEELKKSWKVGKDFNGLKGKEQFRVIWWITWGNPRGLYFLFLQVKMTKTAREAFDAASTQDKEVITLTLTSADYYEYPGC